MSIEKINSNRCFGGWQQLYSHFSPTLNCDMRFAVYLPPQVDNGQLVPVLYWLSGLTCTEENFIQKAGAQRIAAELGMAVVTPDTSPRGEDVPDDPEGAYDFGLGAGFYVNATETPWNLHYHMYDYVVNELPKLIEDEFPVNNHRAISGHSMGGHGALMIALRNHEWYRSVSAFSPVCHPSKSPWGQKAFRHYLGEDRQKWLAYDSCELMKSASRLPPALVDQGAADQFLAAELLPDQLLLAVASSGLDVTVRMHPGYDHSYYFIATFIEQHLRFHYSHLCP